MLTLGAFQGLRCGEIARLQREDLLDQNDPPVMIVAEGKGGHQRILPLHPATMEALHRADMPWGGYVFRQGGGGPFAPGDISRVVNTYLHAMGIPATAHQLRHWFGTKTYAAQRHPRGAGADGARPHGHHQHVRGVLDRDGAGSRPSP